MPAGMRVRDAALRAPIDQRHQQHQIDCVQRQRSADKDAHGQAVHRAALRVQPVRFRDASDQTEPGMVAKKHIL